MIHRFRFLPTRRYEVRVLAMALYLGRACLSVTSRSSIETAERIKRVFAWVFPSTCPTLC